MKFLKPALITLLLSTGTAMAADDYTRDLQELASGPLAGWTVSPVILDAVREQNTRTAELTSDQIASLDATWRNEIISGGDLITSVLNNSLSQHLADLKNEGRGQFTEIFVSDIRGLNVGQSDVTSDYWQGDEAKWQVPHETSNVHISNVEFDESSQSYQSQISLPILDSGAFIGVITVGIDVEQLAAR